MRTTFHQFFRPTKAEMDELLATALICYDANVLLNVYRYSDETKDGLVQVFQAFVDRTYLPHQVALEYARNRAKTIVDQVNLCKATEDAFKKVIKDFIAPINKQPFLSHSSTKALEGVIDELASKREILESMITEDRYAELILGLFDKRIGVVPDKEKLTQFHNQAADRYAKGRPPGYEDLKDKDIPCAYGDYIVWRQLMDIAMDKKRDFVLVIDDTKLDWWTRLSGKTIGPRPELLEEFSQETGRRVWLFTSKGFLIATREAGSTNVSDNVINEVGRHLVAQTSALVSEDKLSNPNIDRNEANEAASEDKLIGQRVENVKTDDSPREASLREDKLTTPGEKTPEPTGEKTSVAGESEAGEE